MINVDKAMDWVDLLDDFRDITGKYEVSSGKNFPYDGSLMAAEQYKLFIKETIMAIGLALLAVSIIVTILLANLKASFLVLFLILMIDVELLGLIYW